MVLLRIISVYIEANNTANAPSIIIIPPFKPKNRYASNKTDTLTAVVKRGKYFLIILSKNNCLDSNGYSVNVYVIVPHYFNTDMYLLTIFWVVFLISNNSLQYEVLPVRVSFNKGLFFICIIAVAKA